MKLFTWFYPQYDRLGDAAYQDDVLRRLERLRATGLYLMAPEGRALVTPDPLRALLRRLAETGLETHLGFLPFSDPPNATPEMLRRRYAYQQDGHLKHQGLCPAWPENRLLAIHRAGELCEAFAPTALHLDYIRYYFAADPSFGYALEWEDGNKWLDTYRRCECPLCQTERLELLGREPNHWDRRHPGYVFKRLQQRVEHVDEVLRGLRRLCEQRGMQLSAAGRVLYLGRALIEGQDWVRWCKQGLVDQLCLMNYSTSTAEVERRLADNRRLLQHISVERLEGLARRSSAGENTPEALWEQAQKALSAGCGGGESLPPRCTDRG